MEPRFLQLRVEVWKVLLQMDRASPVVVDPVLSEKRVVLHPVPVPVLGEGKSRRYSSGESAGTGAHVLADPRIRIWNEKLVGKEAKETSRAIGTIAVWVVVRPDAKKIVWIVLIPVSVLMEGLVVVEVVVRVRVRVRVWGGRRSWSPWRQRHWEEEDQRLTVVID